MAKNLKECYELLNKYRFIAVGQRFTDFLSLLRNTYFEALIICERESQYSKLCKDTITMSYESEYHIRQVWNNNSIGCLCGMSRDIINKLILIDNKPLNILTYASSSDWEKLAENNAGKVKIIGLSSHIKELIDDKISTRSALRNKGLPVPDSVVIHSSIFDFNSLKNTLGIPFIVQKSMGSSGTGTFLIQDECALKNIQKLEYTNNWLASRYMGATTLNYHGLALPDQILVSMPSVQATGIVELSSGWATYCGNDFGAVYDICKHLEMKIRNLIKQIGYWLLENGYEGLFGVDIIINGNDVYIAEINPRLQGSTWLLSEIEAEMGLVPLVIQHFLWHLGERLQYNYCDNSIKKNGAYLIMHSTSIKSVYIIHHLQSGAYTIDQSNKLHWKHPCIGIQELQSEEIFIFGLPATGEEVKPGAVILRFASRQRLISNDGRRLNLVGKQIIKAIKKEIKIYQED